MFLAPDLRLSILNEYETFQLLSTMQHRDANWKFLIVMRLERIIVLNQSFLDCDQSIKRNSRRSFRSSTSARQLQQGIKWS